MLCCRAVPASPQRPDCRFTQRSPYLTQRFCIDLELVLTASPKSPPDAPSAAAGREDQSDFGTANPNSAMKAAPSGSAASMANDGEGVSKATSMTRLSSATSLAFGLGDSAGESRAASSRELSQVDHFQVEELANAHAASRTPSEKSALSKAESLDGERRSLMGGSESEAAAARANGNYGSMVDSSGDDEKSVKARDF